MAIPFFFLLLTVTIGVGFVLLNYLLSDLYNESFSIKIGASFFLGISSLITCVSILAKIIGNSNYAAIVAIIIHLLIFLYHINSIKIIFHEVKKSEWIFGSIIILLVGILILIYWMPSVDKLESYSTIGSLHSQRYAWISNYIKYCATIPVLGQNIGQSILSYMVGLIFTDSPYLFLFLWLLMSQIFLGFLVFGFINLYINNFKLSILGVLIFLFGNSALSLTRILTIDSGNPFVMNGYTDSLLGVASIFLLILYHNLAIKIYNYQFKTYFTIFILIVANYISAPQNIIYLFSLIIIFLFYNFKKKQEYKVFIYSWASILIGSIIIAIPLGGMLTPKLFQSEINIPGLMNIAGKIDIPSHYIGVRIFPGYPFHFGGMGEWQVGQTSFINSLQAYVKEWEHNIASIIWILEQSFITSIRVLFWPLLGIILIRNKIKINENKLDGLGKLAPSLNIILSIGFFTLIIGFLLSYSISLNGYKWELSRFMIPGVAIGMVALILTILENFKSKRIGVLSFITLFILLIGGPVFDLIYNIFKNLFQIFNNENNIVWSVFFGSGPVIDSKTCLK